MVMVLLRATIHDADGGVQDICSRAHTTLYDNTPPHMYSTFFLAEVDLKSGALDYVNAGHLPPMLYRHASGGVERLHEGGSPLGLLPINEFETGRATLAHGDALVIFTDGITECGIEDGDEFGDQRLRALVEKHARNSAGELTETILDHTEQHSQAEHPHDDATLVIVKRSVSSYE